MRLKFIVTGRGGREQETETYSPTDKTIGELIKAAIVSTGNTRSDAPWECRTKAGALLDSDDQIGNHFEEGEIGELRGTLFLNQSGWVGRSFPVGES